MKPQVTTTLNHNQFTREKTKQSKTSFLYSFLLLPKEKREAIYTVYSFCRHSDDIVDDTSNPDEAKTRLDEWRADLERCFNGNAHHPIMQALTPVIDRFNIPRETFHALIDGCEMDLNKTIYNTFDELERYCYHVASAVGLMCIEIFGYRGTNTHEYAIQLGKALQLTNIMRDVHEDARNGRFYLPAEDFERFGYSHDELTRGQYTPAFTEMMRYQYQRADQFYTNAQNAFDSADIDLLFPAEIMRKIYYQLLQQLQSSQFQVFDNRLSVSKFDKGRIALATWLASRWSCAKKWAITSS